MSSRVLVDASNLRVGGGVQVAASFLDELVTASRDEDLCSRFPWLNTVDVEVSPLVHRNMTRAEKTWTPRVVNRTWRSARPVRPRAFPYDVEFNLFGPIYAARRGSVRITGFADGTSLFPPALQPKLAPGTWRQFVRRQYSAAYFRRGADHVVVEAENVRRSLIDKWHLDPRRIHVVANTVNGVFYDPTSWKPTPLERAPDKVQVCYIARGYPHKNVALLGAMGSLLLERGVDVEFVLTLTREEWESQTPEVRRFSVNLGPIDVAQAPTVYTRCEAAIFPSLLESFSATPLEALVMGCPLVASDRPFVSEFVGDAAEYFDPYSPQDAADALARVLTSSSRRELLVKRGDVRAQQFPSPEDRAVQYFALIQACLERTSG